jgi:general secretion pathway protein B
MSLILEALRKSEAERRLGSAPDVLTPMPVMHAPAARRPWALLAICATTLIAGTAWVWWSLHATPPRAQPVVLAQPARFAVDATSAATAAPIRDGGNQASARTLPADRLQARIPPPLPLPTALKRPAEAQVAGPDPSRSVSSQSTTKAEAALAATPAQTNPQTLPATTPVPAAATDDPALLSVSDLSASERSALPALTVTMHVYADSPAQRFMIVDGQRVGEGGRLGEGIVIVHIRHDGAEIDAHGRHLLLPNP